MKIAKPQPSRYRGVKARINDGSQADGEYLAPGTLTMAVTTIQNRETFSAKKATPIPRKILIFSAIIGTNLLITACQQSSLFPQEVRYGLFSYHLTGRGLSSIEHPSDQCLKTIGTEIDAAFTELGYQPRQITAKDVNTGNTLVEISKFFDENIDYFIIFDMDIESCTHEISKFGDISFRFYTNSYFSKIYDQQAAKEYIIPGAMFVRNIYPAFSDMLIPPGFGLDKLSVPICGITRPITGATLSMVGKTAVSVQLPMNKIKTCMVQLLKLREEKYGRSK